MKARALVLAYLRAVWRDAEPEAVERYLAPGYIDHDPPPGFKATRAGQRRMVEGYARATAKRTFRVRAVLEAREGIAVRHEMSWRQTAPFFGQPKGAALKLQCLDIYKVRGGRITASWHIERFTSSSAARRPTAA